MRRLLDRLLKSLARRVLAAFFRRIEVVGAELVPTEGPLLVVANHVNSLIDPVLLLAWLPRTPRFLAKSTLWEITLLKPLLELASAVPVYRRQDVGADTSGNLRTFERCHAELAQSGTIALFPEGKSHSEPSLQPLKTGAARIALEAEAEHGPLGVRVLPVGLVYDAKQHFRSRVLVQVGDPLDPCQELERHGGATPEAVRALTARIDRGLDAVTLGYGSWEEARRIARAADLYDRPALDVPRSRRLAEEFRVHRAFVEAYAAMRQRHPERVDALAEALERYDALLQDFRFRDAQVAATYPPSPVLRFLTRSLVALLVGLPLGVVGTLLSYPPYWIAGRIGRQVRHLPDLEATYKLFPALGLFPLFWGAEAALAGWASARWLGAAWIGVVALLLLAPLSSWVALRFHETWRRLVREARAYLLLGSRGRVAAELKERRQALHRQLSELIELYVRERAAEEDPASSGASSGG